MRKLPLFLLILALTLPAAAQEQPKIAVLGLKAPPSMEQHTVRLLDELLLTEITEAGEYEVFGSSDITSMITLEEERVKLTGCADDSCLVEIGGALGVNLLIAASLGSVGEKHLVNLKLLDVSTARVLKRSSEVVAGSQAELIDALKRAVIKVMASLKALGADPGAGEVPAATSTAEVEKDEPVTFLSVAPWLALGITVAAAGAGGALVGLGAADGRDQEDQFKGNDRWNELKDSSETRLTAGSVLLGVAGAAAVGTLVLFLVGNGDGQASAGVVPVHGGVMATVGFGFSGVTR